MPSMNPGGLVELHVQSAVSCNTLGSSFVQSVGLNDGKSLGDILFAKNLAHCLVVTLTNDDCIVSLREIPTHTAFLVCVCFLC